MAFINYVVGFLFTPSGFVLLCEKNHGPPNVAGKWNGVGGKVEAADTDPRWSGDRSRDDSFRRAMTREFYEEVGVRIPPDLWVDVLHLEGPDFEVRFYRYFADSAIVAQCLSRRVTDRGEPLAVQPPYAGLASRVANLSWVLPMCMHAGLSGEQLPIVVQDSIAQGVEDVRSQPHEDPVTES